MAPSSTILPISVPFRLLSTYSLLLSAIFLIPCSDAQSTLPLPSGPEKQAHIHFFFHDIISGSSPTAIQIVSPVSNSASGFGRLAMADNALTETADPSSKLLGRAQGMYASASQSGSALLMALNFVFSDGEFNGSTVSILGRNALDQSVREMAVVGGSGALRMARGYATAKTTSVTSGGDAVVEYDVYAVYYQNIGSG